MRPFQDERVRRVFASYPDGVRDQLLRLRELVFDVADELDGVGPIEESLRWGEPAYLTTATKTGTTLRLHAKSPDRYAMYVHCQTDLVATFKDQFGDQLSYDGTRAVRFAADAELPVDIVRDCIALTLTYKLRRR